MSKVMTLYMLFEALKDGRVTMDTEFRVSDRAHAMGGSTLFLDQSDRPTVEELIKGIIVQSGNDACVVVAEGLAGSEDAFARLMNERAPGLGLRHSTFTNSTGWPDPNHRMSMEDLGKVATAIIREFPEYYGYFALQEWPFDGRAPQNRFNRNPVLGLGIGADGLKTGHTQEAGYGLVGSALQGNRRIVFVITGLETMAARAERPRRSSAGPSGSSSSAIWRAPGPWWRARRSGWETHAGAACRAAGRAAARLGDPARAFGDAGRVPRADRGADRGRRNRSRRSSSRGRTCPRCTCRS
jgi:hypothetical protein